MQQFSKGCKCCQTGKWLCIFLTYRCEADCSFCPAPFSDDRIWTEFGPNLKDILHSLDLYDFQGVSFSGGDCFLVPDRLEKWLKQINNHFPDLYYWVYTNGLRATSNYMSRLARFGMNEIRFNIAGIGYQNQTVLKHIREACRIFEHVTIEIPSIPEHYSQLIEILPVLVDYGIHYLNLHEFILSPQDLLSPNIQKVVRSFNIIGQLEYDEKSKQNTKNIINFCMQNKLYIAINSCSIDQKEKQMLYRRLCWAKRTCQLWEKVTETGLLETYCRKDYIQKLHSDNFNLDNNDNNIFMHPDNWTKQSNFQRVLFMPPMDIEGKRILI